MARRTPASGVEVLGAAILSIRTALEFLKLKAQRILSARGLPSIEAKQWYSLQNVIGAMEDIREQVGPYTVRAIGYWVPSNALFPPNIDALDGVLRVLDAAYRLNHRGTGDIGGYHLQLQDAHNAWMRCDNPYPCDFDQGLLEALYDRFQPPGSQRLWLEHAPGGCRIQGDDACTYHLKW